MDQISLEVKPILESLARNEWSDEAREKALEARRRKSQSRLKSLGYRVLTKAEARASQPSWINQWERRKVPKDLNPKLIRFKDRLVEQEREFGSSVLRVLTRLGRKVGLVQKIEKISGSKGVHSSWIDKRTGYRYDFHPAEGMGVTDFTAGKLVETSPDGTKRELKGPKYNLFKKNCQMADDFLPAYIKRFNTLRHKERKQETKAKVSEPVANILTVINGGPGSGFHGHKGIPGQRGGSLPEGSVGYSGQSSQRSVGGGQVPGIKISFARGPSEQPEDIVRRAKHDFTITSQRADLYDTYANELESKRRSKWMPLKAQEIADLQRIHATAAKHFYDSANQSTLLRDTPIEEQQDRLRKADHHLQLAMKYDKRLKGKTKSSKFTSSIKDAFVRGALGGSVEEVAGRAGAYLGSSAGDIAIEGIRGGFEEALRQKGRKVTEVKDYTVKPAEFDQIQRENRRLGREMGKDPGPFSRKKKEEITKPRVEVTQRGATFGEKAAVVGRIAKTAAELRAKKTIDELMRPDPIRRMAEEQGIAKQVYQREMDNYQKALKSLHSVGGRVQDIKTSELRQQMAQLQAENNLRATREQYLREAAKAKGLEFDLPEIQTNELVGNLEKLPVVNLTHGVRREILQDREYLVAPLTMIVPGVLAGSKGPLLYPEEEISRNPTAWNGMPIVVNHPMKNGMPVEARSPGILERYQIGTVFNAKYKGKLVAEGWFDIDRTRKTNVGVYEQLINNQPIELSTGLYTDNVPSRGDWNGREYHYVARNYRPDHLAILLGSKGACSIKDGCGVLINRIQVDNSWSGAGRAVKGMVKSLGAGAKTTIQELKKPLKRLAVGGPLETKRQIKGVLKRRAAGWEGRSSRSVDRTFRRAESNALLKSSGLPAKYKHVDPKIQDAIDRHVDFEGWKKRKTTTLNIVKKIKGGFKLVSHKGKSLGTAKTKSGIMKRERQVEYFKHVRNEVQELVDNISLISAGRAASRIGKSTAKAATMKSRRVIKPISKMVGMRSGGKVIAGAGSRASKVASKIGKPVKTIPAEILGKTGVGKPPQQIFKAEVVKPSLGRGLKSAGRGLGSVGRGLKAVGRGINRKPKTAAVAAGAIGYQLGKNKKPSTKSHALAAGVAGGALGYQLGKRKRLTANFGYQLGSKLLGKPKKGESKIKTYGRNVHHAAGGFGGAVAGGVAGAALGTAAIPIPVVGSVVGGAAGAAAGSWAAKRHSQQYGKSAGTASDIGGIAGAIATPGGAAKVAKVAPKAIGFGAKAAKVGKTVAKGAGRLAGEAAVFEGTTRGLDKLAGKPKRPRIVRNAWTAEARRKSIERRKLNSLMSVDQGDTYHYSSYKSPASAVLIGASAGIGSRLGSEGILQGTRRIGKAASTMKRVVAGSFKDAADPSTAIRTGASQFKALKKSAPGMGRRFINLIKKLRIRRI